MQTFKQRDRLQQVYDQIMREEKMRRLRTLARPPRYTISPAGLFWAGYCLVIGLAVWWVAL